MNEARYDYCPYDGERLAFDAESSEGARTCPRCGFVDYGNPKPCVAILIVLNGKVLLARRGIEPAKGKWDIPGGFVEPNESAEDAVIREALEETTLHVVVADYLGSVPDVYDSRSTPTLNLGFLVHIAGGHPTAQSDVEALAWFGLDDLPQDMAFAHQSTLLQLLKRNFPSD